MQEIFVFFFYYILMEEVKCPIQSVGPLKNEEAKERLRPPQHHILLLVCF